jgi:hypothetical protein
LYTQPHPFYGGIDLHARTMDVCLLNHDGAIVVHRNLPTSPEACLKAIAPLSGAYGQRGRRSLHVGPGWLTCVLERGCRLSLGTRSP